MEDKRVTKTKRNIKQTLISLLQGKPFDTITVTELCSAAEMSRITFYTHYTDKYDLVEEMFRDLLAVAETDFYGMQKKNNSAGDPTQSYINMLDSILNLYETNTAFLRQMSQRRNPYLYYSFYSYTFKQVEMLIEAESGKLVPRYGARKFTAFLCNGLWAYIDMCYTENADISEVRNETRTLLRSVLSSEFFARK